MYFQIMVTTRGVEWRQQYVETAPFYTNKEVDHLIKETEVCALFIQSEIMGH